MVVLPHVLDVSVEFTPVHNFLPQKSIHSPFILPHKDNRELNQFQRYYEPEISDSTVEALKLGVEKLGATLDKKTGKISYPTNEQILPPENQEELSGGEVIPENFV